jgi:hypothetical protein
MRRDERLKYVVQDILFREWDPIGVNDNEFIIDEYDSYVPKIAQMLDGGTVYADALLRGLLIQQLQARIR